MRVKVSENLDRLEDLIAGLKKSSDEIGAVAVFVGSVRATRGGEKVLRLEYEAHESLVPQVLQKIAEEMKDKYGVVDAIVEHRVGTVQVGEDVMYVLVASKHREEGFQALAEMVDKIKHESLIWKKEVTEKGEYWIEGSGKTA